MLLRLTLVLAIAISGSARDLLVYCCIGGGGSCELTTLAACGEDQAADGRCAVAPADESAGCCAAPSRDSQCESPAPAGSCCGADESSVADACADDAPCVAEPPPGCCDDCVCCQPVIPPARPAESISLQLKHAVPSAVLSPAAEVSDRRSLTAEINSRGPPLDRAHARALLAIWLI